VPVVSYHWDFGDGISSEGPKTSHCYTQAGDYTLRLTAEGVDGLPAQQNFLVTVNGHLKVMPNLTDNRRFVEPTDH
jgi:hypothetical protein